ncbi:MaoC family dehydratase [Kocuria sp. CPCC 205235]|uniref:MaoC family dehydratase n=1 Tax=Kocuria sp. CPCC 205235 TaxID=3073549 RepID=UPI0034D57BA3
MNELWLDDIKVGARFETEKYEVSHEDIVNFARQFDPQPFHLSDQAAADTFFEGLAASGWHTAAITMRLLVTSGISIATGIIGASVEVAWPSPTRAGDVLHVELTVESVKVSATQPDRGFATVTYNTTNQEGKTRQRTTANLLVFKKPELT